MEQLNVKKCKGDVGKSLKQCTNRCICCKYPSPINTQALVPLLDNYPNKKAAKILRDGFMQGFRLGYKGDRSARESPNLKSVIQDPELALKKLQKEMDANRLAGPFREKPIGNLIVSPIGIIPKSEPGKYRLIQHLSYPEGDSINDGIDPELCTVKYTSFDSAVQLVVKVGKGAMMAKEDIESAFRLLPVHPEDFALLGMKVRDKYFVDKALPMGASCSPFLFETFSTFVEWVARNEANTDQIIHFCDDYLLVGGPENSESLSCAFIKESFENTCEKLGVPLSPEKVVGPTTKITYLGLEIDSVKQMIAIPQQKLLKITEKVKQAMSKNLISLKELQSVIGSLSFVCKAVSPGRAFLRRLIDVTCGKKNSSQKFMLPKEAKCDLEMWLLFLERHNGVSIIPDQAWLGDSDVQFFTDASGGIGFGGYYRGQWFQGRWPEQEKERSIAWLEFFPIVVSVVLWGEQLKGKRIVIRSDNKPAVAIINKQTSKCPDIMKLLRFFVLQCLKFNLAFCAKHIPGESNDIADALSRFQMERFRQVAPGAAETGIPVPPFLWTI